MLKNKKMRTILIGVLVVCAMGSTIFAKSLSETAEIFYNNIKIYIDGAEIVPKDANGNTIEPFTMNGTTYLPVRAISNAFGQDVEWYGATQSIYIGKKDQTKPDNYLDRIQYSYLNTNTKDESLQSGYFGNKFEKIIGTVTDYQGKTYTNGYVMYMRNYSGDSSIKIEIPLNSQYKKLNGKLIMPKEIKTETIEQTNVNNDNQLCSLSIYGDSKKLFYLNNIMPSMPIDFNEIDLTGVNTISFEISSSANSRVWAALTDLALYK